MVPTQSELPFKLTQLLVLALFVVLTLVAAIRFRPEPLVFNNDAAAQNSHSRLSHIALAG